MTSPFTRSITNHLAPRCGLVVHVAHHLGGEQLDEALGGKQGFCGRLDKLLAALLHMHSGQGLNVAPFCRVVNLLVDFFDKTDFQIQFLNGNVNKVLKKRTCRKTAFFVNIIL